MNFENISSGRSTRNIFDGSFDYRTLLPSGFPGSSSANGASQVSSSTPYISISQDIEEASDARNSSSSSSSSSYGGMRSLSSFISSSLGACTEMCNGLIPEMTWRERLIGCATCMVAGYILSLGSFFRIRDLLFGNPLPLVLNATVGNLIALAGSCFLSGPANQFNKMWSPKRQIATAMYLGSVGLTIVVAMSPLPGPKGLILLLLLLSQYVSITWYCLSYIPMAQEMVAGYVKRLIATGGSAGTGEY